MKLYKYNQKNNKVRSKSFFNGSERLGFSIANCETRADIDAAEAKGFALWPPVKPVKKTADIKVGSNDGSDGQVHSSEGAAVGSAGN